MEEMEKIPNWLNSFEMKKIEKTALETGDRTLVEFLEIVKQTTKKERKDKAWWICFPSLKLVKGMTKHVVKIGIGPIRKGIVPLLQKALEEKYHTKVQECDFGYGKQIFFVEQVESVTEGPFEGSAMKRKLNEPRGKKEIKEEIEEIVKKLSDVFKAFNGRINRGIEL